MKSRKVKAYNANKRRKSDIPLEVSDDSDVNSDSFYHDEIDDYNNEKDDELSTDDELIQKKEESSEEEEVLPITDDEKEESEDDDKEKSENEDDDLPNRDAWGKKKSTYYSTDFVDQDWGKTYREEDAEAAKAEEEEALAIQKSVYHNINAENLGVHLFFESSEESAEEEETVNKDAATKEEIIKYLKKETKIFEYKALLESSIQKLKKILKLWHLIQTKRIRSKRIELYVRVKRQILYLIVHNINIYYMLVSTGKYLKHHPVNQSIAHFKQLLDDLESQDQDLASAMDELLSRREDELDISSDVENISQTIPESTPTSTKDAAVVNGTKEIKKKKKVKHMETEAEKEVMSLINEVKDEMRKRKLAELDEDLEENKDYPVNEDEANADEKRVISYEIAKNKGLIPHRKKEYRNPRVRHRMKYRKAQIRRKGQVRNVVKEVKRYEGEPTGINVNVVKSIKFK